MTGTRHLDTYPGKRVRVAMRDGTNIDGRYLRRMPDKKSIVVISDEDQYTEINIPVKKIRALLVNPRKGI